MATEQTNTLPTMAGGIASLTRSENVVKEPLKSQPQVKNKEKEPPRRGRGQPKIIPPPPSGVAVFDSVDKNVERLRSRSTICKEYTEEEDYKTRREVLTKRTPKTKVCKAQANTEVLSE